MDTLTLEYILTGIFFGGLGIAGLALCTTIAYVISHKTVDTVEMLLEGPPKEMTFNKPVKLKDDNWKSDPLPVEDITAGSMF
jgi:hypothetical protein